MKEKRNAKNKLDMVFFYADPLVVQVEDSSFVDYTVSLDLETEYQGIVENLMMTGKKFLLMKEALSIDSLEKVLCKNPKIIHISCHGSFQ